MHRTPRPSLVAGLFALSLLSACSSSTSAGSFRQPKVSAFSPGPCRTSAPDILGIGRDLHGLGSGKTPPAARLDDLKATQDRLDKAKSSFDAATFPAVQGLIVSVGIVRFRAVINQYDPALGKTAMTAYDGVITACTGGKPVS